MTAARRAPVRSSPAAAVKTPHHGSNRWLSEGAAASRLQRAWQPLRRGKTVASSPRRRAILPVVHRCCAPPPIDRTFRGRAPPPGRVTLRAFGSSEMKHDCNSARGSRAPIPRADSGPARRFRAPFPRADSGPARRFRAPIPRADSTRWTSPNSCQFL